MYLMYVDDSGDPGLVGSPSPFFVLSGIVIHDSHWQQCLSSLVSFRRSMKVKFGLKLREEIHSNPFIFKPGKLMRIKRNDRLTILREFIDEIEGLPNIDIINVVVDKSTKATGYDVFNVAWTALIQRFENTICKGNFRVCNPSDKGLLLSDPTNGSLLTQKLRKMRHYNLVPNSPGYGTGYRNRQLTSIVEDPVFRDSQHSFFIQAADVVAWMLTQKVNPCQYIRKKTGHGYFDRLNTVLCKYASNTDPQGIVRI